MHNVKQQSQEAQLKSPEVEARQKAKARIWLVKDKSKRVIFPRESLKDAFREVSTEEDGGFRFNYGTQGKLLPVAREARELTGPQDSPDVYEAYKSETKDRVLARIYELNLVERMTHSSDNVAIVFEELEEFQPLAAVGTQS